MSSPRLRRLNLDHERLESRFQNWPAIRIKTLAGDPPEKYQVTYNVRGLYSTAGGDILDRSQHVMEVNLSLGYPRRAPQCKMLTPIFHPNFDEVSVCIGDFWAASEGLDDLIVRIGRMIAYQEYNTKSPLNGLAAKWAAQNGHLLPVDKVELAPPLEHGESEDTAKLVVTLEDERFAPPDARQSPPLEEASVEAPPPIPRGVPRLDFGMIAVALAPGRTAVGRATDSHIQLSHTSVSANHAEILEHDGGYFVRDLGSTNGTTVNDLAVTEAMLTPGDRVCFGELEGVFQAE